MDKEITKLVIAKMAIELRQIERDIHNMETELSNANQRYIALRNELDEIIDNFDD